MDMEQAAVGLLIALFSRPGSALLLAMGIFGFALVVLGVTWWREVRPLARALLNRILVVGGIAISRQGAAGEFARQFEAVQQAMMRAQPAAPDLQRGWIEYRQTFVELEPEAISTSAHAGDFFGGAGRAGRTLEWWANIFVAIGLLFTFLGIVAALSQATRAIDSGGGAAQMQAALGALLSIAAAKFWTSVAGIAASLLLRIVGRRWRDALEGYEAELCEGLDACVTHISPQSVALQQLQELRRLGALLGAGALVATQIQAAAE